MKLFILASALIMTVVLRTDPYHYGKGNDVPRSYIDTPKQYLFKLDGPSLNYIDNVLSKCYRTTGYELSTAKSDSIKSDLFFIIQYFRDQRNYQDTVGKSKSKKP